MHSPIAIVGLSCLYPEARTPMELWENVLAQRRAFRRIPSERLRAEDYLSLDASAPDKTYSAEAAVIEGYEFDRVAFRVVGSTYRSADLAHWLALDVASQALADAGFKNGENLPRESTGVILGNTLTGEFSRANLMRLRWPYVRRVLESALIEQGWTQAQRGEFLQRLEADYKAPFPPVGEETLAGGLSNTIAGRICNQFDLKGGGYTIDGACASSLLAVANACSSLAAGDLDVALAGGVDLSLDPFEIVGFAKTGALAPELMRIYDARSAGFWPGEGCGFVVLMRHEDAVAEGRRIYATIRGWGISSDGSGGITRPEVEGQLQSIRRAYRRAGYGIDTVEYFEGHGTGTNVGDATELKVISRARREARADALPAAIGSIKANIGHTKAAAGIAGLLKATLAVHTQTLPPTTGCEKPHAELSGSSPALRVLREPEPWPRDRPLRASVSAMGFGGVNAHVTLEGATTQRRSQLSTRERTLSCSAQDVELFLFRATDPAALLGQVENVLAFAARLSRSELADLAAELARQSCEPALRAAVIASSPAELAQRLAALRSLILDGVISRIDFQAGVFVGSGATAPRLGFLFPGQGSPAHLDGGIFRRRFERVRELYDAANLRTDGDDVSTEVAQPAIVTGSVAGLRILRQLGVTAGVAVGHSLGEITALHWAGAFDEAALLRIARVRGQAMADLGSPTGAMAAIAAPASEVNELLQGNEVSVVGLNSPRQTVISGEASAVNLVIERSQASGLRAVKLPVSHAFHTPLVAAAAPVLAQQLSRELMEAPQRHVVSTVTGAALRPEDDLRDLLCRQVTSPVKFIEAVTTAADGVDLWIEVGPGQVLSGLAADSVSVPVVALDTGGPTLKGLLQAIGAAFALGAPVNHTALFDGRFTRPFNLDWRPKFFVNPCELAPVPEAAPGEVPARIVTVESTTSRLPSPILAADEAPPAKTPSALALVRQLVAERAELPMAAIKDESRLLGDLHLNSISVGQLVAEVARRLNLPPLLGLTDFANATVGKVAQAMEELVRAGSTHPAESKKLAPAGIDSWVRPFVVDWVEAPLPARAADTREDTGGWRVLAPPDHPLAATLPAMFSSAGGAGVVLCLPAEPGDALVNLLLRGAREFAALSKDARFILVQHGFSSGSFARTLHLESPGSTVCVVDVPFDHPRAAQWVRQEALAAQGFTEARYDRSGVRREPRLRPLPLLEPSGELPLGPQDVLLVTGGGKGIAAECALSLARKSGARLVLLGRSQPVSDAELAANLDRIADTGIQCRYFAADVTDAEAVRRAVTEAEREFGKVTGFIHAAGANFPQLIPSLDEKAFHRTLAPKIQGARNVLGAIQPEQLRLFVTFGSIIGRAGLAGEGDYAVANEWLTQLTEEFQVAHPQCRCLAAEWSVWSGVGMGARLARVETLRQQGITPISPEAGVEMLEQLLRHRLPSTAVVVTGRFGDMPTLRLDKPDLPFLRFLEEPRVFYPGVELVVDVVLSADSDPYLNEHMLHGERLFPAVLGLEAMAQVAMAVTGQTMPPQFKQVELSRPVVVPRAGKTTIRLAALVREDGCVEVAVRSEETGFAADHFKARCRFDASRATEQPEQLDTSAVPGFNSPRLPMEMARDVYEEILFHEGRFRRVAGYRHLRARECLAEIEPDTKTEWFGRYLPGNLVLGDAGARDGAIHCIQACIPHRRLLPMAVERIELGGAPCMMKMRQAMQNGPTTFLLHAKERCREGDTFTYDLALLSCDGCVLERWTGLKLRAVEELSRRSAWTAPQLAPWIERKVEELTGAIASVAVTVAGAIEESSDAAIQQAAASPWPVRHRSDGKPEVAGRTVSAAHAGWVRLAVAGQGTLACDLEQVAPRERTAWEGLLGSDRMRVAGLVAAEAKEDFDTAATRVWSAMECLKKAGAMSDAPLTFAASHPDCWVVLRSGALTVATCAAVVRDLDSPLVVGVLA